MFNIMKNVWKILLKRKGYLLVALVFPIILTLLFTSIYTNNSSYTIGIVNEDNGVLGLQLEKTLEKVEAVKVKSLEPDKKNLNKLVFNEIYMIINIDKDFTEKLLNGEKAEVKYNTLINDEMTQVIKGILNSEIKSLANICNNVNFEKTTLEEALVKYNSSIPKYDFVNNKEDKGVNILSTMGIILYLMFISAGMSSAILIEDEKSGTKNRILMGKISEKQYYGAMGCVFFVMTAIPVIEYYIMCKVFKYNIGFEHDIILLVLLLLMVLLAVVFTIMLSTLIKNKTVYGMVSATLTIPIFMLSGAFWEFSMMSEPLQKIASALPIRWFFLIIEKLQGGLSLASVMPIIFAILLIIILMFFLSIFFAKNKIVLVKEK